jgi:hypothetical protein
MEGRPGRGERSAFNSITRFNGVGFFSWLQWRGMGGREKKRPRDIHGAGCGRRARRGRWTRLLCHGAVAWALVGAGRGHKGARRVCLGWRARSGSRGVVGRLGRGQVRCRCGRVLVRGSRAGTRPRLPGRVFGAGKRAGERREMRGERE